MKLEVGHIFINDIQFASESKIENGVLYVDEEAVKAIVLEDEKIKGVKFDIAKPGESVRITPVKDVIEPIDDLFLDMSNKVIELTSGLINDGVKDKAIINLKNEIEATKKLVDEKGTQEDKDKLMDQLLRLQKLGNKLNSTEGIVFTWKDRMMKMTGSFAAANAIIGAKYRIK